MSTVVFLVQREACDPLRAVQRKVLFPIESAFAAALASERGHQIVAFDLNLRDEGDRWHADFDALLAEHEPELVVSVPQTLTFLVTEERADTAWAFAAAKRRKPGTLTAYAGAFATSQPHRALEESGADWVILGEYDEAIASLAERGAPSGCSQALRGVLSRDDPARAVAPAQLADLDVLPFPAYGAFDVAAYFSHRGRGNLRYAARSERYTHYMTSRGCTLRCCFCNVAELRGGRRFRRRSIERVLDDLQRLRDEHGIEEVHFLDENLNLDRKRMAALCDGLVARKLGLSWFAAGGMSIYPLDEATLRKMRQAGCYRLHLAIESGSERVLREVIHKPIRLDRAQRVLEQAHDMGFEVVGYFIMGLPGEGRAELEQTLALASHPAFDYVTLAIATPLEGTELTRALRSEGLLADGLDLEGVSRRARATVDTAELSRFDLEQLRWRQWDQLNFGRPERRERARRLLGLSPGQLAELRQRTADGFRERWQEMPGGAQGEGNHQLPPWSAESASWLVSDGVVALGQLGAEDLSQNLGWMQDDELRRLLEVTAQPETMAEQRAWYGRLVLDPTRATLRIVALDGEAPRYLGNVMLFDIDLAQQEAEVAVFVGAGGDRRRGYGSRAIRLLVSWARRRYGALALRIKALRDNAGALRLYRRLGFHEDRRRDAATTEDPLRVHLRLEAHEELELS